MSYLGNSPEVQNYTLTIDKFNGDGACTVFTLSRPIDDAVAVEVLVNNVQQTPFDSYTISGGVITFSAAPSIGSNNIVAITRATTIFTKTQVGTADIQDGAITSSKIANGTVIAADIADGSVTGPKLGQTAINANNIVDGAVTGNKLGPTSINANNIVDGAVTGPKIGATAISSNNISAGAITGDKIGLTAINANNIVNGGVTVDKGGTGLSTLTANSVVLGNGTDPVQLIAPGTTGNVLTSNGTNWTSQAAAAGGGDYIMQVYTSPATWTKPATVKAVKVTLVGGGGGGGGIGHPGGGYAGGGGAGGGAIGYFSAPSIPGPVTVTVGAGGTTTTGSGGTGGTSSFGPLISATGGGGGTFVISGAGVGGAGGAGTPSPTVSIVMTGGAGSSGIGGCAGNYSGAGGSLSNRSSTALFGLPTGTMPSALTAIAQSGQFAGIWGLAGAGRLFSTPTSPGLAASGFGHGGSGAAGSPNLVPGGVGTGGIIIVEEFY